jgi:uncharacterized SAM-binding protein YcdF (DUF218 family)
MSFTLSKVLALVAQPSSLLALLLAAGLVLMQRGRRARLGSWFAWGALAGMVLGGILPLGNVIILPLEQRFAENRAPAPDDKLTGLIILGGFEDGWVSAGRGQLAVNESAERLTEGTRLALKHPEAKVVFTGGVGSLWPGGRDAVGPIAGFLREAGIADSRIILEGRSRNTYENALFTAELLAPKRGERWALVTSAYHMPRAVGVFRKAGFEVAPYPVDYRTRGPDDIWRPFDRIPAGLQRLDLAVNEWLGLVAYRLMGRIDEILPGPEPRAG